MNTIKNMNKNFYSSKKYNYKNSIIHPLFELKRRDILKDFFNFYIKELKKYIFINKKDINNQKQILYFIANIYGKTNEDPVLLSNINVDIFKIVLSFSVKNVNKNVDLKNIKETVNLINKECKNNLNIIDNYINNNNINNNNINNNININKVIKGNKIILSYNNVQYSIPIQLYHKVQKQQIIKYNFDVLLFCLITRHQAIYNYNTMQLAVPSHIYKDLDKHFNVNLELFGSSFNKTMNNFCGLFYDIEKYFGCVGNFFDVDLKKGFYVCNPPFESYLFKVAYDKILKSLNETKDLTIFNVLPAWDDDYFDIIREKCEYKVTKDYDTYKIYKKILKSKYVVFHRLYCRKEFPFFDYFNGRYINATHCHIIILSNNKKIDVSLFNTILLKYKYLYTL